MQILLTNDDGVEATGLWALHAQLTRLGDVTVVAPRSEQSGVGHAITYRTAITADQVCTADGHRAHVLTGTPADCVKFGVLHVFDSPPDLVVSGINPGLNLGCNVFYSGTVAAALEGAMYGIPSVAFSCRPECAAQIDRMAAQARRALNMVLRSAPGRALAWNVNLPTLTDGDPRIVFTGHWHRAFRERYLPEEVDGAPGYRLDLPGEQQVPPDGPCDVIAVREGRISVTPLRPSLTDQDSLRELAPPHLDGEHLSTEENDQ